VNVVTNPNDLLLETGYGGMGADGGQIDVGVSFATRVPPSRIMGLLKVRHKSLLRESIDDPVRVTLGGNTPFTNPIGAHAWFREKDTG